MGNGLGKLTVCFTGNGASGCRKHHIPILITEDEGLGHSFCYIRPDPTRLSSSRVHSEDITTTFQSISGASVSANTSTPLSTAPVDLYSYGSIDRASAFESSTSFASLPLQPIPKNLINSGPFAGNIAGSGPMERGFLSGPIERGFLSGPIEKSCSEQFPRSYSHENFAFRTRRTRWIRALRRAISNSIVAPIKLAVSTVKEQPEWIFTPEKHNENLTVSSANFSSESSLEEEEDEDDNSMESQNLQWAQGKAGEDRVHVVVSEEHGWVFVGIYDGFNGPDAPDYLLSNLYNVVRKELKGLLWDCDLEIEDPLQSSNKHENDLDVDSKSNNTIILKRKRGSKNYKKRINLKCEWDGERLEAKSKDDAVLEALSEALRKTEEAYLDIADKMLVENPELALMGSCVLVMLMKGEDVYVMNVGDSRAVIAQKGEPDYWIGKIRQDLKSINEETMHDIESMDDYDRTNLVHSLNALQLTKDHSTNVEEEVLRIKKEHPDDDFAVLNDRVKGSLKVTRAFGAGFLKQAKWNNALLEMFRIEYVGNSPYITCIPHVRHHRLGPKDKFLILSSDGLYQYLTNKEAVAEVELFMTLQPEGDPAQHLVEEVLFRAAKKAGLDFHELLEIPQGDRRRYHDDVSIIVISLEGRIWRSYVQV